MQIPKVNSLERKDILMKTIAERLWENLKDLEHSETKISIMANISIYDSRNSYFHTDGTEFFLIFPDGSKIDIVIENTSKTTFEINNENT